MYILILYLMVAGQLQSVPVGRGETMNDCLEAGAVIFRAAKEDGKPVVGLSCSVLGKES